MAADMTLEATFAFVLDDDDILFLTNAETVKGRDLLRDPRSLVLITESASELDADGGRAVIFLPRSSDRRLREQWEHRR